MRNILSCPLVVRYTGVTTKSRRHSFSEDKQTAGRGIGVDTQGIPISLVNLQVRSGVDSQSTRFRQLNTASLRHRLLKYTRVRDPLLHTCRPHWLHSLWDCGRASVRTKDRLRVDPLKTYTGRVKIDFWSFVLRRLFSTRLDTLRMRATPTIIPNKTVRFVRATFF